MPASTVVGSTLPGPVGLNVTSSPSWVMAVHWLVEGQATFPM
jgi:hypothetical protein